MDLDRYIQIHEPAWKRLAQLSKEATKRTGTLHESEVAELISLYQRSSAQLSHVRTVYSDPSLVLRLSRIVGEAGVVIYEPRGNPVRAVRLFFTEAFPAAVWVSRYYILVSALVFFLPALAFGVWLSNSPAVLDATVPPEMQQLLAESEFRDYYSSDAAENFAATVTLNNIWVSILAFSLGLIPVIGPVGILINNGVNLGIAAAVMHSAGEAAQFWGLITPHGLLEIAAIVIAGAAGLRISWAIIAPGDRTRGKALAEEGLRAVVIIIGLILCFIVAGIIEGFVTPSGLPTVMRVAIGVAVLASFIAYVVVLGQRAERQGKTGLPEDLARPW